MITPRISISKITEDRDSNDSAWSADLAKSSTGNCSPVEYENALMVILELKSEFDADAFQQLFLFQVKNSELPENRMEHAKRYVVDEFIRMQIVAAGFRGFGSDPGGKNRKNRRPLNYNGFVRGSRYNRFVQVRDYKPKDNEQ